MKYFLTKFKFSPLVLSLFLLISCGEKEKNLTDAKKKTTKKPNIIYILTDDLGWGGDVGVFFSELHAKNKMTAVNLGP